MSKHLHNPFQAAHSRLTASVADEYPLPMPQFLDADDFEDIETHLAALGAAFDAYIREIGELCAEHTHGLKIDAFREAVITALQDGPLDELRAAAMRMREDAEYADDTAAEHHREFWGAR